MGDINISRVEGETIIRSIDDNLELDIKSTIDFEIIGADLVISWQDNTKTFPIKNIKLLSGTDLTTLGLDALIAEFNAVFAG